VERIEDEEGVWLRAAQNGWLPRFDLIHERRIYLSTDGGDFRGEELLARSETSSGPDVDFALRLHLHPEVEAKLVGGRVSLRLGGGEGWTLRHSGGALTLEDSVYLGGPYRRPRPSKQIVVRGRVTDYQTRVNWAFRRSDAASSARLDVSDDVAEQTD